MILIAIILLFTNNGKVFFTQDRPGLNEKPFRLIKFRTMSDKRDHSGRLLPDKMRVTKIGVFLRKSSVDELPQLINVIFGAMSLVGPRPLLVEYLPYYTERECLRHSIRPGITGLAQTKGRNNLDWSSRLALDVDYVENLCFILDIKILFDTLSKVIRRKDIIPVLDIEKNVPLHLYRKQKKA